MSTAVCHHGASSRLVRLEEVSVSGGICASVAKLAPSYNVLSQVLSGATRHGLIRRRRHRIGCPHANRQISRLTFRFHRAATRRHCRSRSRQARRHRSQQRRRVHHGQRRLRRARAECGTAGGARRRPVRQSRGDDHQQSLRLGIEGGRAWPAGDPDRQLHHRRRRRHGEHDQRALSAAERAQGISPGRSEGGRLHGARWPVGRLQRLSHGQHRRERRREVRHHARGAGRVRAQLASQGH